MSVIAYSLAQAQLEQSRQLFDVANNADVLTADCAEIRSLILAALEELQRMLQYAMENARATRTEVVTMGEDPVVALLDIQLEMEELVNCTLEVENAIDSTIAISERGMTEAAYVQQGPELGPDDPMDFTDGEWDEWAEGADTADSGRGFLVAAGAATAIAGLLLLVR